MESKTNKGTDKRSIKEIADDMFGITFQREIDAVLGGINVDQLNKLKGTPKGRKLANKLGKLKAKAEEHK